MYPRMKHLIVASALALSVLTGHAIAASPRRCAPVRKPPPRQSPMPGARLERFCAPLAVDLLVYKGGQSQGFHVERGAGTLIHENGYILAAYHATSGGHMHIMFMHDGKKLDKTKRGFRIVATASDYDTALLKMEVGPHGVRAARLGRDTDTGVGQKVLLIGNPGGKSHTIHHGVVTYMHEEGGRLLFDKTDVNPGDSGGSTFNTRGELIGMVQLKLFGGQNYTGASVHIDRLRMGFAKVLADETNHDYKLGLTVDMYGPAKVTRVTADSPAAEAGIKVGDVIRQLGDMVIDDGMHYVCALYDIDCARPRSVKFERNGETYKTFVTPQTTSDLREPEGVEGELKPGLNCAVYKGRWGKLPDFASLEPEGRMVVRKVGLRAAPSKDKFGLTFKGYIRIPRDGRWTFYTRSDDGSKLWIGNQLVVDNNYMHSATIEQSGIILLKKGWHPLKIHYFELVGKESLSMLIAGPQTQKQEVPGTALGHRPSAQ